ncbi:hypothetical protein, partial [Acetobacterium sp.]|uniref:hypothetical protein n=1 Tax=Acetobacterium sp. TaxID=1872094 RepID=UPI002F42496A
MGEQTMKDTLNDLRDDSKHSNNEVAFKKRLFGGYNGKEVSEYIKTLKESLKNAEVSFNERLEEYAAMTAMLEQERDTYMNRVKESEATNLEIQDQISTLSKENEELTIKLQEREDGLVSRDDLLEYESIVLENEELKKELNAYNGKEVSEYIKTLKESLENAEVSFRKKIEESADMSAR